MNTLNGIALVIGYAAMSVVTAAVLGVIVLIAKETIGMYLYRRKRRNICKHRRGG